MQRIVMERGPPVREPAASVPGGWEGTGVALVLTCAQAPTRIREGRSTRRTCFTTRRRARRTAYVSEGSLRRAVLRYNADMRELDPSGSLDMHTSSLCRWLGKDPSRRRPTSKGVTLLVFDRHRPPDYTAIAQNIVRC